MPRDATAVASPWFLLLFWSRSCKCVEREMHMSFSVTASAALDGFLNDSDHRRHLSPGLGGAGTSDEVRICGGDDDSACVGELLG